MKERFRLAATRPLSENLRELMIFQIRSLGQPAADDDEEEDDDDDGVFGTEEDEMSGLQDALASQRCVHTPYHGNRSCTTMCRVL